MTSDELPDSEQESAALRRLARETRDRAAAARVQSRQIARERDLLVSALRAGWAEQTSLLGALRGSRQELEVTTRAFAAALRRDNVPPERMLIQVKELVRSTRPARGHESRDLIDQVVSWSIDAYYAAS